MQLYKIYGWEMKLNEDKRSFYEVASIDDI